MKELRKVIFENNHKGYFHEWGTVENNNGSQITIAIIEAIDGKVYTFYPYNIRFVENWPSDEELENIKPIFVS